MDYDQVELDAMYTQAVYAPNAAQMQQRFANNSELARTRLGPPYGQLGRAALAQMGLTRA